MLNAFGRKARIYSNNSSSILILKNLKEIVRSLRYMKLEIYKFKEKVFVYVGRF